MEELEQITQDEITRNYNSAMDSVHLLEAGQPREMSDEEWTDCVKRNVEHLKIMIAKDYWTTEDLTPFYNIISTNS